MRPLLLIFTLCAARLTAADLGNSETSDNIGNALRCRYDGVFVVHDAYAADALREVLAEAEQQSNIEANFILLAEAPNGLRVLQDYAATNETYGAMLGDMASQLGLVTSLVNEALFVGTPVEYDRLSRLAPFPMVTDTNVSLILNRPISIEACMDNVYDWCHYIARRGDVPLVFDSIEHFNYFPPYRLHLKDMQIRNLLWWIHACSSNSISVADGHIRLESLRSTEADDKKE